MMVYKFTDLSVMTILGIKVVRFTISPSVITVR